MKIPSKIKILGLEWSISRDKQVANASESYGTTIHSSQTINIEPTLTSAHAEQTFLHEILHAVWLSTALNHITDMDRKKEEHVVSAMANGLYHVLKDNKIKFFD